MTAYVILPLAAITMTMFAIEVENLTKRFGDFCAVDGLSFYVNQRRSVRPARARTARANPR